MLNKAAPLSDDHGTNGRFNNWCAMAKFDNGAVELVYIGRSSDNVRDEYLKSINATLEEYAEADEAPPQIVAISINRWDGVADKGRWTEVGSLKLPNPIVADEVLVENS